MRTCAQGHSMNVIIQCPKFEVLLESSAKAIFSGFTLEAAVGLATAWERFTEFAVEVLVEHLKPSSNFAAMYKEMSRQSERQLGAFMALHLIATGSPYKPDPEISQRRNKFVHSGYVPTPEQVTEFGSRIYDQIDLVCRTIKPFAEAAMIEVVTRDVASRQSKLPSGQFASVLAHTAIYSTISTVNKPSFEEALANYKMIYSVVQHLGTGSAMYRLPTS